MIWNLLSESSMPPLYEMVLFIDTQGNIRPGFVSDNKSGGTEPYLLSLTGGEVAKDLSIEESRWTNIVRWAELPEKPDDVQRVFISQPMSGRTITEIESEREALMKRLREEFPDTYWIEIASFDATKLDNGKPIEELGKCISLMQEADIVLFSPKWATSVGCTIEHSIATKYGMWRYYLQEDGSFMITD